MMGSKIVLQIKSVSRLPCEQHSLQVIAYPFYYTTHHYQWEWRNIIVIDARSLTVGYQCKVHPPELIPAGWVLSFQPKSPLVARLPSPVQGALPPMQHLQQEYYMHEVIVVWSCELLQQLSNVMIAGESSAPPPAGDWTAPSRLGTINQEISL